MAITKITTVEQWEDFYEYLKQEVHNSSADFGSNDLVLMRSEYENLTRCVKCGSCRFEYMDILGRESRYVLAQRIVCRNCGTVIGEVDKRAELQAKADAGEILAKDMVHVRQDLAA